MSTSQYDLALINKVEVDNEEISIAYDVDGDLLKVKVKQTYQPSAKLNEVESEVCQNQ